MLRYEKNKDITFERYADLLETSVDKLTENIKEVCFYQKNARLSDSSGKKVSKRIIVRDGDIKTFFRWFISGKIEYMNLSVRKKDTEEAVGDKGFFAAISAPNYEEKQLECKTSTKKLQALKKKLEDLSVPDENNYREKEYTDLLTYGGENSLRDNYQEMLSKKLMMRAGITDVFPRIVIEQITDHKGKKKDIDAFNEVKCVRRKCNTIISKDDWILYASALIEIPNHIFITQADLDEYEKNLRGSVLVDVPDDKKEQAIKECLLALGYVNNDAIIQYQCQKIKGELPRVLQYVIYQKCYKELSEKIEFAKNDVFHPQCVNVPLLKKQYNTLLCSFGVKSSQMKVDPVKDVIHDYRPYLKAVYYYQGIKPEFLCRMVNDLIAFSKKEPNRIIDGFGGSGACTMNGFFTTNVQTKQVYNDFGLMNTAFYRCLQSPMLRDELIEQIQGIIDEAFSNYNENSRIQYLSNKYEKLILDNITSKKEKDQKKTKREYWGKSIHECEQIYVEAYNTIASSEKKDKNDEDKEVQKKCSYRNVKIEDRLYYYNQKMDADTATIRNVERYFHVFMLQLNMVYLTMTEFSSEEDIKKYRISDVDLAVLFFFYNTLSHRHFYNDCTIDLIGKMMANYRKWLGYGAECFKKVKVLRKDALKLLCYKSYNTEDTTWYLDIPYVETDSSDYVAHWFDMKNFVKALSNLRGNYIVSSRCNICLPNAEKRELVKISKDELTDITEDEVIKLPDEVTVLARYAKELNIFSFFSSFVDKTDDVMEFIESLKVNQIVKTEDKNGNSKKEIKVAPIETEHISTNNKATYILIPYTKMSEEYYDEDNKVKRSLIENSSVISEDYVRRMLAATHYSNVPVDIMVTNIDIDVNRMPIQPTYSAEGKKSESVYVLPTFKTGVDASQYMVEPAVMVPMEECKRYCEEEANRKFRAKFWRPITIKIAIQ